MNPNKWKDSYIWEFEAYPFFTSGYNKAAGFIDKKYYTPFLEFISFYNNGQLKAYNPKKDILSSGRMIIAELLSGNDGFLKEFKKVHNEVNNAIDVCLKSIEQGNYKNLEAWWFLAQQGLSNASYVLFNFDYTFDEFLINLKKENTKDYEIVKNHIYTEIPSFFDQANSRLIELDKKYPNDFNKVYETFVKEYGWFQNSYKGVFKISKSWLKKHLEQVKKGSTKEHLVSNYVLPKKYKLLVQVAKIGITFRDDKKKLLLVAVELMDKWLKYICKKNNFEYDLLQWLTMGEILEMINLNKKEYLKKAKKYLTQKKRLGILTTIGLDDVDVELWNKIESLHRVKKGINEFKGICANKGVCRGIVKIILDPKKDKFNNNEILVTSMTRPEFMPLMSKALAFVTNEGGITCHAAIVAREMKKPCIIGTKIATQILKDGDFVEVDANIGIVRIIKS